MEPEFQFEWLAFLRFSQASLKQIKIICKSSPCIREGNGTPLQYSVLENPMDGGAWWAAVHGVAKSRTRLSDFTFTFHLHALEKEMATHSSVLAWRIPGTGSLVGCRLWGRAESDMTRKLWYIYTMEYYSDIKKNTFESVLIRWMKLEPIIQSEVRHQYSILMHIYWI